MKNKVILFSGILVLLFSLALIFGCGQAGGGGTPVPANNNNGPVGTLDGYIFAADGVTPVAGATVTLTSSTTGIKALATSTTTNTNGYFIFTGTWITAGTHSFNAQKGNFSISFNVTVTSAGGTTNAGTQEIDPNNPNVTVSTIAVVEQGPSIDYDFIGELIRDLGYTYTTIEVNDINGNYTYISTFDAIFINCSDITASNYPLTSSGEANLISYVETAGGSIYTSDWAGDYIERCWPNAINWLHTTVQQSKVGAGNQSLEADVVDSDLQSVLGKDKADIFYDLPIWVVVSSEGTGTTVLLRGSPEVSSTPYIYSLSQNSKRNNIKANEGINIIVHNVPLALSFQPAGSSKGTVLYTTFHNEPAGHLVSEDVKKLLKDFIFTL